MSKECPTGKFSSLPLPPVAKLPFGADTRNGNDMGTPNDCHSGLGFGGVQLAMCILKLDFPMPASLPSFRERVFSFLQTGVQRLPGHS